MNPSPTGDCDSDGIPPTQREVCSRILALAATLWRAQIEMHLQRKATEEDVLRERFIELSTWVQNEQLADHLSGAETELHATPLGKWTNSQVFETIWRFESLAVLLWATGHFEEMPSWLETVDGQTVIQKANLLGKRASLLSNSHLRDEGQIDRAHHAAEFWHWRCRTEMLRRNGMAPPPGDTYEGTIGRALMTAVSDGLVTETIDGDVAVNGVAYANLPQEDWASLASISIERHYATNWLMGYAPGNNWDDTPTDT